MSLTLYCLVPYGLPSSRRFLPRLRHSGEIAQYASVDVFSSVIVLTNVFFVWSILQSVQILSWCRASCPRSFRLACPPDKNVDICITCFNLYGCWTRSKPCLIINWGLFSRENKIVKVDVGVCDGHPVRHVVHKTADKKWQKIAAEIVSGLFGTASRN